MLKAQNIKCKVYLEGVQVKFNRIEIREQCGAPTQCTISFPANDKGIFIYPKTVCQVFYKHPSNDKEEYYLIFEGQLIGYGIQRNFDRRELQFSFSGLLYNWSTTSVVNQNLSLMSFIGEWVMSVGGVSKEAIKDAETKRADKNKIDNISVSMQTIEALASAVVSTGHLLMQKRKAGASADKIDKAMQAAEKAEEDLKKAVADAKKDLNTLKNDKTATKEQQALAQTRIEALDKLATNNVNYAALSGGLGGPNIFGATLLHKISTALLTYNDVTLDQLIRKVLDLTLTSLSTYYNNIASAFKIHGRLKVVESKAIEDVLTKNSAYLFLSSNSVDNSSSNPKSILQIFMELLSTIGYTIYEMATPSLIGTSKITGIFMAPPGEYLSPISCNFIFNDEIQSLNFNRNIDEEPTRAMTMAKPFATSGFSNDGGISKILLATVVPQGRLGSDSNKDIVIRETKEEIIRGINMAYRDETTIASLYMLDYLKSINNEAKSVQGALVYDTNNETLQNATTETVIKYFETESKIRTFQNNIANAEFYLQRARNRTMSVITTYSPYRICGLPGLIFDNNLPYIFGKIESIFTSISADGAASQSLTFTNVRFHVKAHVKGAEDNASGDVQRNPDESHWLPGDTVAGGGTATDGMDVIDFIPYWYQAFNKNNVHDAYYQYVTGNDLKCDLLNIANTLTKPKTTIKTLLDAAMAIDALYERAPDKYKQLEKITKRRLVDETSYWIAVGAKYDTETSKLDLKNITEEDEKKYWTQKMFYKFRQNRIKTFFEIIDA